MSVISFVQFPQKITNQMSCDNEVSIDDFVVKNGSDQYDIGRYIDNRSNISDDLKQARQTRSYQYLWTR